MPQRLLQTGHFRQNTVEEALEVPTPMILPQIVGREDGWMNRVTKVCDIKEKSDKTAGIQIIQWMLNGILYVPPGVQ